MNSRSIRSVFSEISSKCCAMLIIFVVIALLASGIITPLTGLIIAGIFSLIILIIGIIRKSREKSVNIQQDAEKI